MNKPDEKQDKQVNTYFASPERADSAKLTREISLVSNNPVIDGLMKTVTGLLAVLDEHRQIVALNDTLLKMLGIDDPDKVLGLRPGEAIGCIHAHDMPGGCGTGKYCSTCGAAIAIVASLENNKPEERKCVATIEKNDKKLDICLKVQSAPLTIGTQRFLLLFLQDITYPERWAALERAFFHDISNTINNVLWTSKLIDLRKVCEGSNLSEKLQNQISRLAREVEIQKILAREDTHEYRLSIEEIPLSRIVQEMRQTFENHPASAGKSLLFSEDVPALNLYTDVNLLLRVLNNMIINALEATDEGDAVKVWVEHQDNKAVSFCVWNKKAIAEDIARRIFQRHFSTKEGSGRGTGTHIMKLLGEQFLGGTVDFTTSEPCGTTFRFTLYLQR
ncbi:MAG: HAMP domain-containing sensor histidine kinase [bacterium]